MNKLQKLIAFYREKGLSKAFLLEVLAGIRRIWRRTCNRACRRGLKVSGAEAYAASNVYWEASHEDKVLYLTLDVEWKKPENLGIILDTLQEKQVQATFFLLGKGMEENADWVRRICAEGHAVGNHTFSHPRLTRCTRKELARELEQCAAVYHTLTGAPMAKRMRPPYGEIDHLAAKWLHKLGYRTFLWNLHVCDWNKEAPATWAVFEAYLGTELKKGGVILQHSYSDETAKHLGSCIDYCHAAGYRFAALDEFPV